MPSLTLRRPKGLRSGWAFGNGAKIWRRVSGIWHWGSFGIIVDDVDISVWIYMKAVYRHKIKQGCRVLWSKRMLIYLIWKQYVDIVPIKITKIVGPGKNVSRAPRYNHYRSQSLLSLWFEHLQLHLFSDILLFFQFDLEFWISSLCWGWENNRLAIFGINHCLCTRA